MTTIQELEFAGMIYFELDDDIYEEMHQRKAFCYEKEFPLCRCSISTSVIGDEKIRFILCDSEGNIISSLDKLTAFLLIKTFSNIEENILSKYNLAQSIIEEYRT